MVRVLSVRAFGLSACLRFIGIVILAGAMLPSGSAWAQKPGGILRITHRDSPASMSIHEEGTISAVMPMMGVFNNLVMFDQHEPAEQPRGHRARPRHELDVERGRQDAHLRAAPGREMARRQAVHRGRRQMHLGPAGRQRRRRSCKVNFRKGWYANVESVTTNGDYEAVFHLKTPQPALLALLASGFTPVYPVPRLAGRRCGSAPIGTGPFKFVEYKPNQSIKVARNPNYWKPGRPYLDGIEYTIIPNRSTAILSFVAGKFDMTFPYEVTVPLVSDVKSQMPQAQSATSRR